VYKGSGHQHQHKKHAPSFVREPYIYPTIHGAKMRKPIVLLLGLLILWAFAPFIIAFHPAAGGFLHREMAYRVISDRITDRDTTAQEKADAIMAFVYLNETQLPDWALAQDVDVLQDLVRNIGWPDQKTNAMVHLLDKQGIDARMVLFPCHAFAEVEIDGALKLFDPAFNGHFFVNDAQEERAGLADLLHRPERVMTSRGTKFEDHEKAEVLTCGNAQQWDFLSETRSTGRKLLGKLLYGHIAVFGNWFVWAFQDWHLFLLGDETPLANSNHYRARCLDLLGRSEQAMEIYAADSSSWGRYFLFKAQVERGEYERARKTFMDARAAFFASEINEDTHYAAVQRDHITKLQQMDGKKLMEVYRLSETELIALFELLDLLGE